MSALKNAKHERFARNIFGGLSGREAYQDVYPDCSPAAADVGASRLLKKDKVSDRIAELSEKAAEKAGVTVDSIIAELVKIGFSDIRKAVEWRGNLTRETDNPDGGDVLVIKEIFSNNVRLIDSDKIDSDTAAAIAEIRQSATGGLSVKFHDKQAALINLGKHLGMFKEKVDHSLTITLETLVSQSMKTVPTLPKPEEAE